MATNPRRPRPPGPRSHQDDGISPGPSFTVRIRKGSSREAIPRGSVASRVKLLQSRREPLPGKPASPAPKRTREDIRASFGRRVSRRFGNPAIQSAQPSEESGVESKHSYLGLRPVRTNHEEEHASAESTIQCIRSPEINGQIDQTEDETKQYDAASPWEALSRTISVRTASHRGLSPDLVVLKEIDSSGHNTQHMTQTSIVPCSAKKKKAGKPRRSKFIDSEASIATTSTIRRQSVRDLFDDYGIQRPAGLASREVSRNVGEQTRTTGSRTFCHVCSWSNSRTSIKCWRCCHQFCIQCKKHPSRLPIGHEKYTFDHEISTANCHEVYKSIPKPNGNRIEYDPVKQYQARPGPTPIQSRKGPRKPSSSPIRFPDFYDTPNIPKSPKNMSPVHSSRQEQEPVHALPGRRTSVKDSPFLLADSISPRQSLRLFPPVMRGETHHTAHNHRKYHSQNRRLVHYTSTVPSESLSCDSHVCRATHHGHEPFHHASACPTKKPRQRVPECTENGYIADTSRVDDAVNSQSTCNSRVSRPDPRLAQQSGSGCSHYTCTSRLSSHHSQIMKTDYAVKHDIPEYVECRGYPRTGHARHGSPVSAGIVGECQHCLDDCQCTACQNTHHSVRCCVHTDHQTIVHHHHTPQQIVTVECSEDHVLPKSGNAPLRAHKQPPVQSHSSNGYHLHAVETNAKRGYGSEKQTVFQKVPKPPPPPPTPPPPPPMVSNPWKATTKTDREAKDVVAIRLEKAVEKGEEAEPLAKENTPPFQRNSQENSSLETSAGPTDGTWNTIPSLHDSEHIHGRRNSCPPSRKHTLDKHPHEAEMTGALGPRTQTTPPEFEKASRKLSTVQALKQQLLSHRNELQRIQKDCTEQINIPSHSGVAELANKIESKQKVNANNLHRATSTPSIARKGSLGSKKRNWKLKLVDWSPGGKEKGGEEHRLSDDEVVSERDSGRESYKAMPSVSTTTASMAHWIDFSGHSESGSRMEPGKEHNLSVDEAILETYENDMQRRMESEKEQEQEQEHEHECVWKQRFEEVSKIPKTQTETRTWTEKIDLGILGITVLVHLNGRSDLVARAESWTGGELEDG